MKLGLIIFIITCFSVSSFGQKCVLEIDDVDPRTKLPIKRTEDYMLFRLNNNPFTVKGQSVGDKRFLKFRYYMYNSYKIEIGSDLVLTLTDHSTINLTPRIMPSDTVENEGGFMKVSGLLIFPIPKKTFNLLKDSDVISIRFYVDQGHITKEIKDKKQSVIRNILRCIE